MASKHYLFAINHPSQFHVFKNLAKRLMNDGHKCIFFIQKREIIEELVKKEGFEYRFSISPFWRNRLNGQSGLVLRGIIHLLQSSFRVFVFSLFNQIDMYLGTDIVITHVANIFRKPSLVFTDDDFYFTKQYAYLAYPFASYIFAADVVDIGKWKNKKIAYKGNQKLGYLHPNVFKPNIKVLDKYGLEENGYTLIRFVSFNAMHDALHGASSGMDFKILNRLFPIIIQYGKVIINTEFGNTTGYNEYKKDIDPEDMHSLLHYARLFITDSQSMYVEAGLLGTPAIRSNSWVDHKFPVNVIKDLEQNYGLGVSVSPRDDNLMVKKTTELIQNRVKAIWLNKRAKAFDEYTDFSNFLYWFVSEYPQSAKEYNNNPQKVLKNYQ